MEDFKIIQYTLLSLFLCGIVGWVLFIIVLLKWIKPRPIELELISEIKIELEKIKADIKALK